MLALRKKLVFSGILPLSGVSSKSYTVFDIIENAEHATTQIFSVDQPYLFNQTGLHLIQQGQNL